MTGAQILEAGEYCEKCLGEDELFRYAIPGSAEGEGFLLCGPCIDDRDTLVGWLAVEIEKELRESGDWEESADGRWKLKNG